MKMKSLSVRHLPRLAASLFRFDAGCIMRVLSMPRGEPFSRERGHPVALHVQRVAVPLARLESRSKRA